MSPCASSPSSSKPKITVDPATPAEASRHSYSGLAGQIVRERTVGPFRLSENIYPVGLKLPIHAHREALLTFVIEGTFRERYGALSMVCRAGSVRFLPAGEMHTDEMESQVRCLHITSYAEVFERLDRHSVVPRQAAQADGLAVSWLANRLYAEFSRGDASAITIEGLILEIFAEVARSDSNPRPALPEWLRHATDIVEARFLDRLSLAEIASEVGVHYVHLSRQFHKYNRCTIGELIRRRRVQYASHLLAHSETPLAEIALICGFSDQSHLSFLFKRYMGLSPSKFRMLAGRNSAAAHPGYDFNAPLALSYSAGGK